MRHADVAMYGAKDGEARLRVLRAVARHYDPARLTLVGELRRAIEERELVLYYQPKAELANGAISIGRGAGALAPPRRAA